MLVFGCGTASIHEWMDIARRRVTYIRVQCRSSASRNTAFRVFGFRISNGQKPVTERWLVDFPGWSSLLPSQELLQQDRNYCNLKSQQCTSSKSDDWNCRGQVWRRIEEGKTCKSNF